MPVDVRRRLTMGRARPNVWGAMTVLDEIRDAYASVGITLDQPITYGTYYRLRCARCGRMVGNVGDRLLPGMAADLVLLDRDLFAIPDTELGDVQVRATVAGGRVVYRK